MTRKLVNPFATFIHKFSFDKISISKNIFIIVISLIFFLIASIIIIIVVVVELQSTAGLIPWKSKLKVEGKLGKASKLRQREN